MKTTKKYYQYIADPKDTTCEVCLKNNERIFFEETIPPIPVHPNCRCELKELTLYDGELPDLSEITYGQWCASDETIFWNKLPHEYSYPWLRIMLSNDQYIFYNLDNEVLITTDGLQTIQVVDASDDLIEFLTSLKATILFREESVYIKNTQMLDPLAKPIFIDRDNTYYYEMDNGTILKTHMTSLIGMGILPNGTVVVGQYDRTVNKNYYYELLLLKSQLTMLKSERNNNNISRIEFENEYEIIRNQVIKLMTIRYPELTSHEIAKKYEDNWRDIPDDYYIINDVTKEINDIIKYYLNDFNWGEIKPSTFLYRYPGIYNFKSINNLTQFYNIVKTNGPIDLKNQPEWYHPLYIYDGKIVDVDVLGNILYGVLGAYLNIDTLILYMGASAAQSDSEGKPTLDDPRDVMWWKYGYKLYFDKWQNGDEQTP